ncbi:MAG TPA: PilN domain-containing protein [Nitrospirota bacterium]
MIKINLLPSSSKKRKPARKITELQKQVMMGGLILAVVAVSILFFWGLLRSKIASLEKSKASAEARLREQDVILKEVKNVEEERKLVMEKIEIIDKLKKNQSGPVRLLDEISTALPQGVNLISLTEANNNINLEGEAFTNEDVVRFVERLKASSLLNNVMLLETSQIKKEGTEIYKYKLQFFYKGL